MFSNILINRELIFYVTLIFYSRDPGFRGHKTQFP